MKQGDRVAFHSEATTTAKLAEMLVAFANSGGGTACLGVEPRSGRVVGLVNPPAGLPHVYAMGGRYLCRPG